VKVVLRRGNAAVVALLAAVAIGGAVLATADERPSSIVDLALTHTTYSVKCGSMWPYDKCCDHKVGSPLAVTHLEILASRED
jgi:hypothetical protein